MGRFITEHSKDDYRRALSAMAPTGDALPLDPDSGWQRLLRAFGALYSDFDTDLEYAVTQWFPHLTVDLLEEWEAAAGLPDRCDPAGSSYEERIEALVRKLQLKYGATPAYFEQLLSDIGWTDPSIFELQPARFSIAYSFTQEGVDYTAPVRAWHTHHMGEARMAAPEDVHVWRADIEALRGTYARFGEAQFGHDFLIEYSYSMHLEPLADYNLLDGDPRPLFGDAHFGDRFAQFLVGAEGPVRYARCGKTFGIRFREWGEPRTECLMNRIKPAHTHLNFAYGVAV